MDIRNEVKSLIFREGYSIKRIAFEISQLLGRNISADTLSHKLINNTLRYQEAKAIAEILGYELEFKKK